MRTERVDIDERRPCASCGTVTEISVHGELFVPLAKILRDQLAGRLLFLCDGCADRIDAEEERELEREALAERLRLRHQASGMPARWQAMRFESIERDAGRVDAIAAAGEWGAGKRRRGLLLQGMVGRGKSAIAAAAANVMLERKPLRWLSVADLMLDLRMPFDSQEYLRAQRSIDAARQQRALVLDDLDKVSPTAHAAQVIYVAVNGWVEAELPLLVTLNNDLDRLADDFGDPWGEAIASRLGGYCDPFEVSGPDRRLEP